MKHRVVGWTDWDNDEIEENSCSYAERNTIIDHIKEKGYCFTGYDHQEQSFCVPVLNDGKKRCFSQRAWGRIMAEAHGYFGDFDYSMFAFNWYEDDERNVYPDFTTDTFHHDSFIPETNLNENFTVRVTKKDFDLAFNTSMVTLKDLKKYRYIDIGDTLTLKCDDEEAVFNVIALERKSKLGIDEFIERYKKILSGIRDDTEEKKQKRPPIYIFVGVEPRNKGQAD